MDIQQLVQRYRKYCDWARGSGYAPLDWPEYKASRLANHR